MIAIYLMLMASLVATLVIHHQRRKRKRLQQEMADRQRQFEEELRQKEKEQLLGRIETQSSQLKERMRFLTMKQGRPASRLVPSTSRSLPSTWTMMRSLRSMTA